MPSKAAARLTPDFLEQEVTIRGVTYKFRELSIGDYDELVKKATTSQQNALGETNETVDNTVLLKLMVLKSLVSPKLSAEGLAGLPMRAALKLNTTVNRMHYGDEPEEVKSPEDESEEEPAKGND